MSYDYCNTHPSRVLSPTSNTKNENPMCFNKGPKYQKSYRSHQPMNVSRDVAMQLLFEVNAANDNVCVTATISNSK